MPAGRFVDAERSVRKLMARNIIRNGVDISHLTSDQYKVNISLHAGLESLSEADQAAASRNVSMPCPVHQARTIPAAPALPPVTNAERLVGDL